MKQFKLIDAAEDDNLLDYFKSKTFNIKRGWKILNITEKEKNEILYSLAEEINVLLSASGNKIQSHIITGSLNDVCILKIRIKNPKTKAGKSSGLRTYTLVIDKGEFAILFDIYPKNGSHRKDNISDTEKNKMDEIVEYFKQSKEV